MNPSSVPHSSLIIPVVEQVPHCTANYLGQSFPWNCILPKDRKCALLILVKIRSTFIIGSTQQLFVELTWKSYYYCKSKGSTQILLSSQHLVVIIFPQDQCLTCYLRFLWLWNFRWRDLTSSHVTKSTKFHVRWGDCIGKEKTPMKPLTTWPSPLSKLYSPLEAQKWDHNLQCT